MKPVITLALSSRVISKKNSKRWIVRGGKRFLAPSEAYERFLHAAIRELNDQIEKRFPISLDKENPSTGVRFPITDKVQIHTAFSIKGKYNVDADNLHTSVLDVLMGAGVIFDDNQVVSGSYTKRGNATQWLTMIEITIL